ncbi:MAG: hypothetical protein ACK5HP_04680 [Bacilli bacterium]
MKYVEFKNYFYKISKEYGFKKEGKVYRFRNDEVMIIFEIVKSQYSNSVSRFGIGINPYDIMQDWCMKEPNYYDHSILKNSFTKNEIMNFRSKYEICRI